MSEVLRDCGHQVDTRPAHIMRAVPPEVEAVLIAGSVRYGFYSPRLKRFTVANAERLNAMPTAFVGVSLSSARADRAEVETNVYSRKFLASTPWNPTMSTLVTGEINFDLYNRADTFLMEQILRRSGKPHGPGVKVDYTDWAAVRVFAQNFAKLLG